MSGERTDREAIARTLAVAAARPLGNFYKQAGDEDERDHPTLARVIKAIVGDARWRARPNQSLLDVVQDAILALPEHLEVREGRKNQPPVPSRGKPERDIAALLYGYQSNSPTMQRLDDGLMGNRTYDQDYRPAALQLAGVEYAADKTQRRLLEAIREDLADALLVLERRATKPSPPPAAYAQADQTSPGTPDDRPLSFLVEPEDTVLRIPVPPDEPPFTPRPDLIERLEDAWHAEPPRGGWKTSNLVCVIGEVGTGKTRLVREHVAADKPFWIDAAMDERLLSGMVQLLEHFGMDTTSFDTARVRQAFGDLLASTHGPKLVIIDKIPDPQALVPVIRRENRSRVIVTSRVLPPEDWAPGIYAPDMSWDEATAMAASLLPGFEEPDYRALAAAFGNRPLIIEHGCQAAEQLGIVNIAAHCDVIRGDIANTKVDGDWTDDTLGAIYWNYVDRLQAEAPPESLELLRLFCFVSHVHVPTEFAMSYLLDVPYVTPDLLQDGRAQQQYERAVEPLIRYSLVSSVPGGGTAMQPLTQGVLREIFQDDLAHVIGRTPGLFRSDRAWSLFDAGWSIFSVAGRETCSLLLKASVAGLSPQDHPLHVNDMVDSIRRPVLASELHNRWISLATAQWLLWDTSRRRRSDEPATFNLSSSELRGRLDTTRRGVQGDEARALSSVIFDLILRTAAGDVKAPDGTDVIVVEFDLRRIIDRLTKRHQDTPLGVLDLSWFFDERASAKISEHVDLRGTFVSVRDGSPTSEELEAMDPNQRLQWLRERVRLATGEELEADASDEQSFS